jgi:hypothetical protein
MAEVLNHEAEDLRNRVQCRQKLAWHGYSDDAITQCLSEAMVVARLMRAKEIDDRVRWLHK